MPGDGILYMIRCISYNISISGSKQHGQHENNTLSLAARHTDDMESVDSIRLKPPWLELTSLFMAAL